MKKTYYLILVIFCSITFTSAQVTFKPGFRGGVNISHFSKGDDAYYEDGFTNNRDFSSKANFYVGFFGDLKLSRFYSLQPEINYSRQGSKFDYYDQVLMRTISEDLEISYLTVGIANKFTFNKFNVHLGPTIEFVVDQNFDEDAGVDLAFFLGLGYDITPNFGVETRIKKGIVPVLDYSDGNHTNVVFSLGAYYKFDVK
jgi:Outer membrane protein beta-barrel domain